MSINIKNLRDLVKKTLNSDDIHDHQRTAAKKTFSGFDNDTRSIVLAAEMQAGKSGIALALCCEQRLSLSDQDIAQRTKLRDTLYLLTMVDTALLDQAQKDLKEAKNAVVSNFNRFEADLEAEFKLNPPKLIIIDECHYGSNITAVRYNKIFDYLEEHDSCKIVFISATPFGALYAAEEAYDQAVEVEEEAIAEGDFNTAKEAREKADELVKSSIIRRSFKTKLVFHRTSDEYYGVREMLKAGKVKPLFIESRSFLVKSTQRDEFINHFQSNDGPGWSLVRVTAGTTMDAKDFFLAQGIGEDNIFIIGRSLQGIPEDEQTTIERFKKEYSVAEMFGVKFVAITVAGCRAGINFGGMKNSLISTWDSTVASVAAVVQANIGRACGYHQNRDSIHFTNISAVEAYAASLDHLEKNTDEHAASDFDGLREFFEEICEEYDVQGLDVGLTVKNKKRKPVGDVDTYKTERFIAIPARLGSSDFNYQQYTDDRQIIEAMNIIREEYLKDYGPKPKGHRAMRGKKKNWIKAQWVNGDTYDNKEKARKLGTMKERTLLFTSALNANEAVEYNDVVSPGSGELSANKEVVATVFSEYNLSRRTVIKKVMNKKDMTEICKLMGVPYDNTLVVFFKRGEYDEESTQQKIAANEGPEVETTINDESQFSGVPDLIY
jgi:hypothetical protein